MKFTKMNGAGNDFIIINNMEEKIPEEKFTDVARTLCERRLSIGADGVIFVEKPESKGDYSMKFYNADGSCAEMCGNGARCIARYGYEKGLAGKVQKIETAAGLVTGWRLSKRTYKIRLNDISRIELHRDFKHNGVIYKGGYIELGNPGVPHAIVAYPGLKSADRRKLWQTGNALRHDSSFSKGANVNFYDINEDGSVDVLTFERGVEDFTYACGTGTGATGALLTMLRIVDGNDIRACLPGGDLFVTVVIEGNKVVDLLLTGPTNIVAEGIVLDEELRV